MSIEAMRMALDALKDTHWSQKNVDAIAALEAELAKPTNEFHPDWDTLKPYHDRIAELEAEVQCEERRFNDLWDKYAKLTQPAKHDKRFVNGALPMGGKGFKVVQALAQPEQYDQTTLELCDKCGWKTLIPDDCCLNCERNKPERMSNQVWMTKDEIAKMYDSQPEQEPVAWKEINTSFCSTNKDLCDDDEPIPLYTAPPKREWVGLTDADIANVWDELKDAICLDHKTFARAIEAKLREKNG